MFWRKGDVHTNLLRSQDKCKVREIFTAYLPYDFKIHAVALLRLRE